MKNVIDKDVELWEIDKLIPYERNAKKHPPEQVEKIAKSISEFGWVAANAIEITPEGLIINGHGRRLAAIELGMRKVPVIVRDDLKTEAQVKAYRLVHNKSAESGFDTKLLGDEIKVLHLDMDFDMSGFFSDKELEFSMDDLGELDMNALTDDLESQVKEQADDTKNALNEEEGKEFPISTVIQGKLNAKQQRIMARFVAMAEAETDKEGLEAVVEYMDELCQ